MSFLTARGDRRHCKRHAPYGEMEWARRQLYMANSRSGVRVTQLFWLRTWSEEHQSEEGESTDVSVMESVLGNPDVMMVRVWKWVIAYCVNSVCVCLFVPFLSPTHSCWHLISAGAEQMASSRPYRLVKTKTSLKIPLSLSLARVCHKNISPVITRVAALLLPIDWWFQPLWLRPSNHNSAEEAWLLILTTEGALRLQIAPRDRSRWQKILRQAHYLIHRKAKIICGGSWRNRWIHTLVHCHCLPFFCLWGVIYKTDIFSSDHWPDRGFLA